MASNTSYLPLDKQKANTDNANVYAVVADATYPFFAGNKYITSLKIVDQSLHSAGDEQLENGEQYKHSIVLVFAARFEDSPRVARVGDVIRLNKANVKERKGQN